MRFLTEKKIRLASVLGMLVLFIFSAFIYLNDDENGASSTEYDPWEQMTFCERVVESRRVISSSFPVPELDTMPDEYYSRGIHTAPIQFDGSFPDAKQFKTKITEATEKGPNFAGHFTVAEWGCGSNCQDHAVLDNETGKIIAYGIPSQYGVQFGMESKLLVTNPKEHLPSREEGMSMAPIQAAETFASLERRYYKLVTDDSSGEFSLSHFCTESAGSHYLKNN